MKKLKLTGLTLLLTFFSSILISGQGLLPKRVFQLNITNEIDHGMARLVRKGLNEAINNKSAMLLINMNTYGGELEAADSIRTMLLNTDLYTVVFINNNAASAGALISLSCRKIYMKKGASIGAATVVDMKGEVVPDKYQSYMRSMMRSTAEAHGRDPRIAEAMVDPRIYIPGINDSGKVLTMTSSEALKYRYCDGIVEDIPEVLKSEGFISYSITEYKPNFIEKLINFLINPAVSGVLILIMLGGIYYEMQAPGIGIPIIAALLAALLYFAPLYLEGLAENWELLVALAGFILLALEIFIIPGFGIAGISGIILLVFGLTVSMLDNRGFDFSNISMVEAFASLAVVMISMVVAVILFIFTGKAVTQTPMFRKLVLKNSMTSAEGYVSGENELQKMTGMSGKTINMLRPSGKVNIDDNIYNAQSISGFIESNRNIIVVKVEMGNLFVKEEI